MVTGGKQTENDHQCLGNRACIRLIEILTSHLKKLKIEIDGELSSVEGKIVNVSTGKRNLCSEENCVNSIIHFSLSRENILDFSSLKISNRF